MKKDLEDSGDSGLVGIKKGYDAEATRWSEACV